MADGRWRMAESRVRRPPSVIRHLPSAGLRHCKRRRIITASRKGDTMANLSTTFTGLKFENPFLLASAPPTESDSNIMRAFEAGWGGIVCKTIGMHPVVNVKGPKTKFLRAENSGYRLSMNKRPD